MNNSSKSLSEVNSTIETSNKFGIRKIIAFMGPAYLVCVGYMDPGNWATDIKGGSNFGYSLIWVLLMSNIMALLLQSLSAKLGIVRQLDLAQASRSAYPKRINFCLWILAEIAIAACDLAEVLGMAIGLQLIFGLPIVWGVTLTLFDTLLLLYLQSYGMRKIEAFIIALVAVIGVSFLIEMFIVQPSAGEILKGFIPSLPSNEALYVAIGIIGATVMPHNLYLHSSLVQTRKYSNDEKTIRSTLKYNFIDSAIALNAAFFVNAAILILAASTFFTAGRSDIDDITKAHEFLAPLSGSEWAPLLFGIALIASGQSSTITGTLAGQIIMEGHLNLRITPWLRRLITRLIAIVPAYIVILIYGDSQIESLLIFSQVVLCLQLGFAIIPLIHFTSDRKKMGIFVNKLWVIIVAWIIAAVIVFLNIKMVYAEITYRVLTLGNDAWILWITVIPVCAAIIGLLLYITLKPFFVLSSEEKNNIPHGGAKKIEDLNLSVYKRIAVCIDFTDTDVIAIKSAVTQGGTKAQYVLIHINESAGAQFYGNEISNHESIEDQKGLQNYVDQLSEKGFLANPVVGYGNPKRSIPKLVKQFDADLLIIGAHGHHFFKDLLLGTTVNTVRHRVNIPVLVVRDSEKK